MQSCSSHLPPTDSPQTPARCPTVCTPGVQRKLSWHPTRLCGYIVQRLCRALHDTNNDHRGTRTTHKQPTKLISVGVSLAESVAVGGELDLVPQLWSQTLPRATPTWMTHCLCCQAW